jgi:hypothetical protein
LILLIAIMHLPAFSACTCYVDGRLTLHHSCAARTIKLYTWEVVDVEEWTWGWVFKGERTLHSGNTFHFVVQCGMGDCDGLAQIRDNGVLVEFNLPGRDETIDLGTIYDPNRCSKVKKVELPPPGT